MNAGSECSTAHQARLSPRSKTTRPTCRSYGDDAARMTSRSSSRRYTKLPCTPLASDKSRTTAGSTSASSIDDATVETISCRNFSLVCRDIAADSTTEAAACLVERHSAQMALVCARLEDLADLRHREVDLEVAGEEM